MKIPPSSTIHDAMADILNLSQTVQYAQLVSVGNTIHLYAPHASKRLFIPSTSKVSALVTLNVFEHST